MAYLPKPAPTQLPVLQVIRDRWSPLAIGDARVEEEKIVTMFEAARWAPSSFNEQPWRYVYASKDDKEGRAKLESLLVEGNAWAKNAYILAISFAKKTFAKNGRENAHALHDTGCASGYLALQATALGLHTHQMAGFARDRANEVLHVPDDFLPGSMIAIGYLGEQVVLTEEQRERQKGERMRKDRKEFAFRGFWNDDGLKTPAPPHAIPPQNP